MLRGNDSSFTPLPKTNSVFRHRTTLLEKVFTVRSKTLKGYDVFLMYFFPRNSKGIKRNNAPVSIYL